MVRPCHAVGLVMLAGACSISEIDLAGKECPCLSGWVCDPDTNTCQPAGSMQDGAILISDFHAAWTTPNSIRWGWTPSGDPQLLFEYQLVVGRTAEDVAAGINTTVWTPLENPELGRYILPRTGGGDVVVATSSDRLEPDTVYYAQLIARDTASLTSRSEIVQARTQICPRPLSAAVEVATETPPTGWSLPSCLDLVTSAPYVEPLPAINAVCGSGQVPTSTAHFEYVHHCQDDGAGAAEFTCSAPTVPYPACGENTQFNGDLDLSELAGSAGNLESAFIEFSLSASGDMPSFWGQLYVVTSTGTVFYYGPLTYRADGNYRKYQVRLKELKNNDLSMTSADMASPWTVSIGGQFADGAVIRIDELRIRW